MNNLLMVRGSLDKRYQGNKYKYDTAISTSPKVVTILKQQMMHSSVKMTEIYAHLQPNDIIDDVSQL